MRACGPPRPPPRPESAEGFSLSGTRCPFQLWKRQRVPRVRGLSPSSPADPRVGGEGRAQEEEHTPGLGADMKPVQFLRFSDKVSSIGCRRAEAHRGEEQVWGFTLTREGARLA